MKGRAGCPTCNGTGGRLLGGRFAVCDCVRPSQSALRAQHQARINDPRYKSIMDRHRDQQKGQK